jgi:hypothetical protein
MLLSLVCMIVATFGYLPPVAGAITQEIIDLFAIFNALRAAIPPQSPRRRVTGRHPILCRILKDTILVIRPYFSQVL